MKTIFLLFVILFASGNILHAQSLYEIREAMDFFKMNKISSGDYKQMLSESDIQGSPFLNDEFIKGTVYTYQKVQFNDIPLRFNVYNNNLEFLTPQEKILAMAAPEIVEKAIFGDYTMSYIPYIPGKKIRKGFLRIIVTYKQPEEAGAYKDPEPAKFIRKPNVYFIRIGQDAALKVGSKKDLINLFPEHQKELADFIKKNKIKTTKVESLRKLVQYYNSL